MNKKIILIFVIFLIIITCISTMSFAEEIEGLGELNNYKGTGSDTKAFQDKADIVVGVIRNVGVVLSVIILIILGIKYMIGSVEERADYKKSMIPYLVGAFILFTGSIIPQIIYDFTTNF